jgi:hypothetical protein
MFKKKSAAASRLVQEAESHVGYTANQTVPDIFSSTIGRPGIPWAGPFIDVCARKAGIRLPSFVNTASALASFIKTNRIFPRPEPGDIVFFQTASDSNHGQPHVGIVTDVEHFEVHGMFQCVEGQTDSGTPKGLASKNGVYKRNRYEYDVLAFARPNFERAEAAAQLEDPGKDLTKPVVQGPSIKAGMKHKYVVHIQLALAEIVGLHGANRGEFDRKTRAAYANFQRMIGYVGDQASGLPDSASLKVLAQLSGAFRVID